MTTHRRFAAGALGLALGLAACGGATTSPEGTVAGETASPVVPASPLPSVSPMDSASPSLDLSASPSLDASMSPDLGASPSLGTSPGTSPSAADPGSLAATLPESAGGITFTVSELSGDEVQESAFNLDRTRLNPVLESTGKSIEDVTVAVAAPADTSGGDTALIMALRIDGVDAQTVLDATGVNVDGLEQTTLAGKSVYRAGTPSFVSILYPVNDTVYQVMFTDEATAEAILTALP